MELGTAMQGVRAEFAGTSYAALLPRDAEMLYFNQSCPKWVQ